MSDETSWSEGYFLHQALSSLETVGSSKGDGWTTIREFWEALAKGDVDREDAAQWAQAIAERVVKQNVFSAEAKERPERALAALGLVGVQGKYRREREYIQMLKEFGELVDEADRPLRIKGRGLAKHMMNNGYFEGKEEQQAIKAIEHIEKRLSPKK